MILPQIDCLTERNSFHFATKSAKGTEKRICSRESSAANGRVSQGVAISRSWIFFPNFSAEKSNLRIVNRNAQERGEREYGVGERTYRSEKKSLQILLSRTKAGPGRKVKQEQEEISRNHVQAFKPISVHIGRAR